MAVRYRQGRARPWQCYWDNPLTGKRETAHFATEEEARKHDSMVKHQKRFERETFKGELDTEPSNSPIEEITLEMCHWEYLKEKQFSKKRH